MPSRGAYKPESAKYLEKDAVRRLIAAPMSAGQTRDVYLLRLTYWLALRAGEVVRLRHEHFDLRHGCVHVPTLKRKGARRCPATGLPLFEVPVLHGVRVAEILEWAAGREWIFRGAGHNHLSPRTAQRIFRIWALVAGIDDKVTLHTLRHAACSHLAEACRDPVLVRDFARHSSVKSTDVYLHSGERFRELREPLA